MLEPFLELLGVDARLREGADHQRRDRLVELEHDVADEAVADDDVHRLVLGAASGEVAALDVADEVEPRGLEELVRLLRDRVALLGLLADAQQTDGGIARGRARTRRRWRRAARTVTSSSAEQSTLAPESSTATGFLAEGKSVTMAGRSSAGVQAQEHRGRDHLRARAAGGDEGVGLPLGLQAEPDGHGAVRLAADGGVGLSVISTTSGASMMERRSRWTACDASSPSRSERSCASTTAVLPTSWMHVSGIELGEREERAGYGRLGGEVAPHGVQRDPRQGQASLAATRCSPA